MQATLLTQGHPRRREAEEMVCTVYARAFGARIDSFPPLMAAVLDEKARPVCAAGLRTSLSGYFSECYLDVPVEASIAEAARERVARDSVLEVTTLAAARSGLLPVLIDHVIDHGRRRGMRWGLFTATGPLRHALLRRGLALHPLAPARADRVAAPEAWGSYYETAPWVCAVADPRSPPVIARETRLPAGACCREAAAVA